MVVDRGSDTCLVCKKKATKKATRTVQANEIPWLRHLGYDGVQPGDNELWGFCDVHDPIDSLYPESGWRRA
jgi:hypothetical protein